MNQLFDVLYKIPKKSFAPNYQCRAFLSENKERDKALHAKQYVRYMPAECVKCKRVFNPNVNFPLVYSVRKCLQCDPWQRLVRFPSHLIPNWFNSDMFRDELCNLLKKCPPYPTCAEVFDCINIRIHETKEMKKIKNRQLFAINENQTT